MFLPLPASTIAIVVLAASQSATSHAATDSNDLRYLCKSDLAKVTEYAVPTGPILLVRDDATGEVQRLDVPMLAKAVNGKTQEPRRTYVAVTPDETKKLCDANFSVATIRKPLLTAESEKRDLRKTVVSPVSSLPSTFSIVHWYGTTYGNFWVPASLPSGHSYQVADFTVAPYNFTSAGYGAHLVVPVLTVSNSNFDHDFDGKGAIFGESSLGCGSPWVSVLESWAIQGYSDVSGCANPALCQAVVFNGSAPAPWNTQPNSCSAWPVTQSYRYLVGANIAQQSVYQRFAPSASSPEYISPVVDSTTPLFRSGGAGVGFLAVAPAYSGYWSLNFSGVNSYTGP